MFAMIRAGRLWALTAAAPSQRIATYVHASGAETIGIWIIRGYVECRKYSMTRFARLRMSRISPIQNLPLTHNIMNPNVNRLCYFVSQNLVSNLTYHDEMTSNICRTRFVGCIGMIEVSDILSLKNQNNDPIYACNNWIECERCWPVIVLSPDSMTEMFMFAVWSCKGIICSDDHNKKPCYDCEDLVCQ